ncbi:hypothetical protein D3C78_1463490 [compost metagenome]
MTFEVFQAQEQPAIHRFAQAVHQPQVMVAGLRLAGFDPLDVITPDPFADLRERPAPDRCRSQFALGGALAAFGRQGAGQRLRQEEVLLRPAALGQVVNDT